MCLWTFHVKIITLTIFLIKADLSLVLHLSLQSFIHLPDYPLVGLGPMEEVAGAHFLHHLCPNKAGQLAKPI